VSQGQKRALLQALLEFNNMTSALIFTRTKHGADRLMRVLRDLNKKVAVIHSNRSQSQRQQALQGFKDKRYQILVATDIAARGIDVKDISHVINYDVPRHAEDYVHRIGRTGRAQAVGEAFTLVSPDEEEFMRGIERFIKKTIPRTVIPDFPYQAQPKIFSKPQQNASPSQSHSRPHQPHHHRPHQPSGGHASRPHQGQGQQQGQRPQQGQGQHQGHGQRPHQGPGHGGHGHGHGGGPRKKKPFHWGRPNR
jgi:ATP-dependent RNA helicase RhlE